MLYSKCSSSSGRSNKWLSYTSFSSAKTFGDSSGNGEDPSWTSWSDVSEAEMEETLRLDALESALLIAEKTFNVMLMYASRWLENTKWIVW